MGGKKSRLHNCEVRMKTIIPGTGYVEQDLIDLLAGSNQFYMAELYTLSGLVMGTEIIDDEPVYGPQLEVLFRWSSLDIAVKWQGENYLSKGMLIKRGNISLKTGIDVDELTVEFHPTTAKINGVPFLQAALNGMLDGGTLKIERVFFDEWPECLISEDNEYFPAYYAEEE